MSEQTEMMLEDMSDHIRRALQLAEDGQQQEANEHFNRRVIPLFCDLIHLVHHPDRELLPHIVR
jgi:flagellin-specific chaperone FliS